jgi:hypothetical protein
MKQSKPMRWAKCDTQIPQDQRLERDHYRIYILMAGSVRKNTNVCHIGQRLIAKLLNLSHQTVMRRQEELVQWSHIKRLKTNNGQQGRFEMLSPVFDKTASAPREKAAQAVQRRRSTGSTVREAARAWAETQERRRSESA